MDEDIKKQLQKDYEALPFAPGTNPVDSLKELAQKYCITYEELLDNISL